MSRLYEKIARYAEQAPRNKAFTHRVSDAYEEVDYATLRDYVDALSAHLEAYRGRTVAIIGHNKLEYAVALLAVLGVIGDAFLIDKELRQADVEGLFAKERPDLILLDDELGFSFTEYPVCHFSVIREWMKDGRKGTRDPAFAGHLLLHTSGTTGEPKLVRLSEENYYGVIPELNRKWGVRSEHSCLLIIPLYHVYALTSLFHGLYAGINNILEWDYKRLGQVLAQTKPHLFMGVPLMYQRIRDAAMAKAGRKLQIAIRVSNLLLLLKIDVRKAWFRDIHAYFGGNYVFGVSAGSLLPEETGKFFQSVGLPVYNVYGMTETSGPVAINYAGHQHGGSVGEILDVNEVLIKDPDRQGVGRVCVKGGNVFDGYLGEEAGTDHDGEYFDTGDLGMVRDGYLYVTGRRDDILIGANGKNVSAEELRRKLLACPGIHACHVVMEEGRLIGYVNTDLSEEALRDMLKQVNRQLAPYKNITEIRSTAKKLK